ncbi:MAG: DNA starvation/stationary phase protection protein [Acidobacteria bacterium]|nr:DNA starvation/stationary phase protection protein [Acidobacteriota bacterium]
MSIKNATKKKEGGEQSFRAPIQLATPTGLKPEEVAQIAAAVNPLIADAFALYIKTKNFHWHLSGSHFREYHLLFDEHADSIFASIDPLAERVRRIGGTTLRSVSHVGELQTIGDDNRDYVAPDEMIAELIEDNLQIAERQRAAVEICESMRDTPTSNVLQDVLDQTERRIWFLYEVSQGGKNEL